MEPDRGGVRKAFRQGPETRERRGWTPLVEARDGGRDLGLRVTRVEVGSGLVLAACGDRMPEALECQPVQEPRVHVASCGLPAQKRELLRRREPTDRGRGPEAGHEERLAGREV